MITHLLRESHAFSSRASIVSLVLFSVFLFLTGVFLLPTSVDAAPLRGFEALQTNASSNTITMTPGSTQDVIVTFKNIGEKTWKNAGTSYVSVYTYDPKYRVSDFRGDNWIDYTQIARLKESSVPVQATGSVALRLKAPLSPGTYIETFHLAAEDTAWIPGGQFTLTIRISGSSDTSQKTTTDSSTTTGIQSPGLSDGQSSPVSETGLSATVLLRSARSVTTKAGEEVQYKVGIKNTGTTAWSSRELVTQTYQIASTNTQHSSWVSSTKLVSHTTGTVKPGGLELMTFKFTAPTTKGSHTIRYQIAVNNAIIPDFFVDIPVEVTSGSAAIKDKPVTVETDVIQPDRMIEEPVVRIGLLTIDEETDWVTEISCNTSWKLRDSENGLLGEMKSGEMVRAFYKNQRYYFNRGKGVEQTHKYLRFVPDSTDAICTIENFDRRKTRGAAYAFNQFRDTLELQYIPYKDEVWVINELPVEEYLYGLGETSNLSHHEFKKALITVARTYALYHWERATKHKGYFHMNAYADDQVYFGYGYEVVHPLIKTAVDETRGVTVNYEGRTAITPYFSRSDGRTRSWSEVWGGSVAWLIGKDAPCDKERGYSLWGHGVGMGATEALCMANRGSDWETILHYFYTGVNLTKRW